MATFDAVIFEHGDLMAPVAAQWRGYEDALQPLFVLHPAGGAFWVSGYLPVNAGLRALAGTVHAEALMSPVLAGLSIVGVFGSAVGFAGSTGDRRLGGGAPGDLQPSPGRGHDALRHDRAPRVQSGMALALPGRRMAGPCGRGGRGLPGVRPAPTHLSPVVCRSFRAAALAGATMARRELPHPGLCRDLRVLDRFRRIAAVGRQFLFRRSRGRGVSPHRSRVCWKRSMSRPFR